MFNPAKLFVCSCRQAAVLLLLLAPLRIITPASADDAGGRDLLHQPYYLSTVQTPTLQIAGGVESVVIAIVDDAFNVAHPDTRNFFTGVGEDLPGNALDDDNNGIVDDALGWDAADQDPDVAAPVTRLDEYYHGSVLSSIVVDIAKHSLGRDASSLIGIVPVKVVSDFAPTLAYQYAFDGFRYALENRVDIILTSWNINQLSPEQKDLIQQADRAGILVISSAGNERVEKLLYPGALASVLTVAATGRNDEPLLLSNHGAFVDVSAPGHNITGSAYTAGSRLSSTGSSYSAAMVAAAAALVKLNNPQFGSRQIAACITNHSKLHKGLDERKAAKFGSGILDIASAVECESLQSNKFFEKVAEPQSVVKPNGYLSPATSSREMKWVMEIPGRRQGYRYEIVSIDNQPPAGTLVFKGATNTQKPLQFTVSGDGQTFTVPADFSAGHYRPGEFSGEFLLRYESVTIDYTKEFCSEIVLVDSDSTITDGSQNKHYSYHSDCKWLFVAPEGKLIEFEFTELDTQPEIDKIMFFDGKGTHADMFASISGRKAPPVFRSWGNTALMWFVSDENTEQQGWKLNARFVEP